jgi:hypothetical protein
MTAQPLSALGSGRLMAAPLSSGRASIDSPKLTEASKLCHRTFAPELSSFFGVDKRGNLNLPLLQGYQESGGATNG